MQDYNEALRLKPDYAEGFNNRGIARWAQGDVEGALQDYNKAIRRKPDYAEAFSQDRFGHVSSRKTWYRSCKQEDRRPG